MEFDCIVAATHLRYDGVRQRPQHVLERLAAHVPVLVVEEPFDATGDRDAIERSGPLEVLRPYRAAAPSDAIDARTIAAARAWCADRSPLVWLYTPMMLALADAFPGASLVFDCMDDLASFAFAPPRLIERERALLARARLVFTGGRSLYEKRRALGERVRLVPSGVEFDHFARARTAAAHPLFAGFSRPAFTYAGVVDERVDFAAVDALAERDAEVVMVGPFAKIDPAVLPRRTNVHFTGQLPYADLPRVLAGTDVAIMPFARNDATASISPTKTPEYLAAGRPVASTAVPDVVAAYGEVVFIADGAAAFPDACFAALREGAAREPAGTVLARAASWDALVERMWNDLGRE